MTDYKGIDYGLGRTNIDSNNIRYGVINSDEVGQAWYDESEAYFSFVCPNCEGEWGNEFYSICPECKKETEESYYDMLDPVSFYFEDHEYSAEQTADDTDIFITRSPYFTFAQFCSPCAPGAVYLMNPLDTPDDTNKGYCFGHDWFESGKAPYPVYDVKTGKLVTV